MPASILAQTAEQLGKNRVLIDSYTDFETGNKHWFLSKNSSLPGSTFKPEHFPKEKKLFNKWWSKCNSNQRTLLLFLANVPTQKEHLIGESYFLTIQMALNNWWKDYYPVFYGSGYACNLFVGESLFRAGLQWRNHDGKYYAASEYWNRNNCPFSIVAATEAKRGDIVAWKWEDSHYHCEIVTKINTYAKKEHEDTGFCSIGAGRGDKSDNGIEKCDNVHWYESQYRKINDKKIKFIRPI